MASIFQDKTRRGTSADYTGRLTAKALSERLEAIDEKLDDILSMAEVDDLDDEYVGLTPDEMLEDIHDGTERIMEEVVALRDKMDSVSENNKDGEELAAVRDKVDAMSEPADYSGEFAAVKEQIEALSAKIDNIKALTVGGGESGVDAQSMQVLKEELGDKFHTESVSMYRNLKTDVEQLGAVVKETQTSVEEDIRPVKGAKGAAAWALVFGILNFILLGGYILYDLGFYEYIISQM
ncbi:MAG: hypothetical protein K5840_07320 [Eubacterium sp.]|nr:hypothetical protein [Eubacterium sp.]